MKRKFKWRKTRKQANTTRRRPVVARCHTLDIERIARTSVVCPHNESNQFEKLAIQKLTCRHDGWTHKLLMPTEQITNAMTNRVSNALTHSLCMSFSILQKTYFVECILHYESTRSAVVTWMFSLLERFPFKRYPSKIGRNLSIFAKKTSMSAN